MDSMKAFLLIESEIVPSQYSPKSDQCQAGGARLDRATGQSKLDRVRKQVEQHHMGEPVPAVDGDRVFQLLGERYVTSKISPCSVCGSSAGFLKSPQSVERIAAEGAADPSGRAFLLHQNTN
ncbi:MAG: hypothetical protein SPJ01_09650 [Butyricicoccus sp.]|nr:hypothetical protein [Butyricicoccus sp.]